MTRRSWSSSQIGHGDVAAVPTLRRRPDQLRVGVAHLVLAEPPAPVLVDEVLAGEAVVDLAATVPGTTQGIGVEAHRCARLASRRPVARSVRSATGRTTLTP